MFEVIKLKPREQMSTDIDALSQRPALAARVGLVMGMWAKVELHHSELLSVMLHADARVGGTLFSVIKAESGRLAMTRAIADERLKGKPDLLKKYNALHKRIGAVGDYRDAMAHGVWAVSKARPKTLALIDTRSLSQYLAHMTTHVATRKRVGKGYEAPPADMPAFESREYGDAEFSHIESEIKTLAKDLEAFSRQVRESQ